VAPAPQLGPVLTAEQQKEYNGAIDQSLEHAQTSLRAIGNRQLTAEQRASREEIQNFIRQAQATRASDLAGARRLAERAELLARNLERSVH
jgi:predicted solute-binding protein